MHLSDIMLNSEIWENRPAELSVSEMFQVIDHPKYNFQGQEDETAQLNLIYSQRWVDSFRQPWEAFSLVRTSNSIPREKEVNQFFRFKYPPSESNYNFENYSAQISRMGGDRNDVKLWWMN